MTIGIFDYLYVIGKETFPSWKQIFSNRKLNLLKESRRNIMEINGLYMIFEFLHRNYIQFGIRIGPRSSPWHHLGLGRWSVEAITQWRLCDEAMTRGAMTMMRWRWGDDALIFQWCSLETVSLLFYSIGIAPSHHRTIDLFAHALFADCVSYVH